MPSVLGTRGISSPRVSVVVINMNGRHFLPDCFAALQAQSFRDFEVILVDNNSTDGSAEYTRVAWPQVKVLALDKNYGFGGGNNRGIEVARGEYIVLLNNDTRVDRAWLNELVGAADEHPRAGMFASKMLFADDPDRVDSAGDELFVHGVVFTYRHYAANHPDVREPRQCLSACAGAALYRKTMLEDIGAFEEIYNPIYYEDVDLGLRAQSRGYECWYVPTAVVYHRVSATMKVGSRKFVYLVHRNLEYLLLIHLPLRVYLLWLPLRVVHLFVVLLLHVPRATALALLKGKYDFFANLPAVLKKRREVRRKRRVTSAQMTAKLLRRGWYWYRFAHRRHRRIE